MKDVDRKAAIAAYKERKTQAGVFLITCPATGARWVGGSRNIDAAQTGLWFQLRLKGFPFREVQAAWNDYGPEGVTFAVVERLKDDDDPQFIAASLRERVRHWGETLAAKMV